MIYAHYGDVDDVRDAGARGGPEQTPRPLDVGLRGLSERARGAVDYRVDSVYGRLQPLPRDQVPSHRAGSSAAT